MRSERICVFGIVQGVGFRPFVSRIADANGIFGSVCNKALMWKSSLKVILPVSPLFMTTWKKGA